MESTHYKFSIKNRSLYNNNLAVFIGQSSSGSFHQAVFIRLFSSGIRHQASGIKHQASGTLHQAVFISSLHQAVFIRLSSSGSLMIMKTDKVDWTLETQFWPVTAIVQDLTSKPFTFSSMWQFTVCTQSCEPNHAGKIQGCRARWLFRANDIFPVLQAISFLVTWARCGMWASSCMECGMVRVNKGAILSETISFGGIKQREKCQSMGWTTTSTSSIPALETWSQNRNRCHPTRVCFWLHLTIIHLLHSAPI